MFSEKVSLGADYSIWESRFYFSTLSQAIALGIGGAVITTYRQRVGGDWLKFFRCKTYLDHLLIGSAIANLHLIRITVRTSFLFLGFGNRYSPKHCL